MNKTTFSPRSLVDATRYFADKANAITFLAAMRWPDGVACVHCDAKDPMFLATRQIWKCRKCRKQFSVKVGTIFEDSPIGLDKWLPALWLIANAKNGISSYELARSLGVTQKTAWFMNHRIRVAMQSGSVTKMKGTIEADEAFIGGSKRNMHRKKAARFRGKDHQVGLMGILARSPKKGHSMVRVTTFPPGERNRTHLEGAVKANVEPGSTVISDAYHAYRRLVLRYQHHVVNHAAGEYVRGRIHTNGIENFWSLLKRSIKGTYVSISPMHLWRYLDEQAFRFNQRALKDGSRFVDMARQIVGRRLTYKELIGADLLPATT